MTPAGAHLFIAGEVSKNLEEEDKGEEEEEEEEEEDDIMESFYGFDHEQEGVGPAPAHRSAEGAGPSARAGWQRSRGFEEAEGLVQVCCTLGVRNKGIICGIKQLCLADNFVSYLNNITWVWCGARLIDVTL